MPPRTRKFDGCWTCRARRIKCDLSRPTCLRCQKAQLECEGYGLVLSWASVESIDEHGNIISLIPEKQQYVKRESGTRRRIIPIVAYPSSMLYTTSSKLDEVLARFDCLDPARTESQLAIGLFRVFPITKSPEVDILQKDVAGRSNSGVFQSYDTRKHFEETCAMPCIDQLSPVSLEKSRPADDLYSPEAIVSEVLDSALESSIFSKTNNAYVHYELVEFAKLTIVAIKGPRYKFSDQGMFHILYPKFFPNIESDNWRPNNGILSTFFAQDTNNLNIMIAPSMSTDFRFFTKSIMSSMRVAYDKHPWTQLVIPFLKQLFFEIVFEEYPESKKWKNHLINKFNPNISRALLLRNLRFAIFCMCLSISWHERSLSRPTPKNDIKSYTMNDELKISVELRKLAINNLNYHLDEYDDNSNHSFEDDYDSYLLLALILQIHIDSLFGVFENYELVYAIGDFILKERKPKTRNLTSFERYLRQSFHALNIFYESTQAINFFNYSISDLDKRRKYQDLNDDYDLTVKENKDHDMSSEDGESDSEAEAEAVQAPGINVRATSLGSRGLSFTVNFGRDTSHKETDTRKSNLFLNQGFKSVQNDLSDRSRKNLPVIPSLNDGTVAQSNGLPTALVYLVKEVVHLTNHKNVFRTRGLRPRNFPRICAEVEDKIMHFNLENHWKLYDNEYNPITNVATKAFISDFHKGLFYHVSCFHNALIVYYKRLISESTIQSCQSFISLSFDHMEKLLVLNQTLHKRGEDLSFNPLFWPLLICGCEIDLKANPQLKIKCQYLWKADCFKRFNYWRSKQILFEVWHRREKDGEDISFMDLVREWEIVLSLG